jgi:hypothetical protein
MSSQLESPPTAAPPHYRAINLWAVLSIASAVATIAMFFTWAAAVFPAIAWYCGRRALQQIQRTPEEYTGARLAKTGKWLAVGLFVIFSAWLIFGRSKVPPGYQEIHYDQLEADTNSKDHVPIKARELADNKTKIFIEGYMVPPPRGRISDLTKFSICRNSDMCKFSMNFARPEDQIHIECEGDNRANYTSYQIGVGGILCIDPDQSPQPYYVIKADKINQ